MPRGCVFSSPHDPQYRTLRAVSVIVMGVLCAMITYRRGAYALLVSTRWATFLGALEREASDSAWLHAFFMFE